MCYNLLAASAFGASFAEASSAGASSAGASFAVALADSKVVACIRLIVLKVFAEHMEASFLEPMEASFLEHMEASCPEASLEEASPQVALQRRDL